MSEYEDTNKKNISEDDTLWAASTTEMTGLTPTPARNAFEAHSYEDIVPYLPSLCPSATYSFPDAPVGNANPATFRKVFSTTTPNNSQKETKKDE